MEFSDHIHASAGLTPVKRSRYCTEEEAAWAHEAVCRSYKIFTASNGNRTMASQAGWATPAPLPEIQSHTQQLKPLSVAAEFWAWICGRSLAGIVGSNPAGSMGVCLL
jgi:hypothetical protein